MAKSAQKTSARSKLPPPPFPVVEAVLDNGLKVRLLPNHDAPVVSLYIFFRVGSRNERPGITGISHLFEHMMFNGAKKYGPKEFDRVLESHGGRSNAYTSNDMTVYYDDFAAEALVKVLDLESDRMRSLTISDATLKSEREVVKEERRLRVDNEVLGIMDEELSTLVYRAHPYRWPVIGWMEDINAIKREDCEAYFRTYYAPNNATLYLSGDFDPKETLALIKKYFGSIKRGPAAPSVVNAEPPQLGERRAAITYPSQAPSLLIGYRGPAAHEAEALTLDVLQFALAVGESSRLNKELVYGQQLVVSVAMDWGWRIDPGLVMFFVELKPDSDVKAVEEALTAQVAHVAKHGLSDRELEKAKNNLKAHLMRELATNNGRAHALGSYEQYLGDWREAFRLASRYEKVTSAQVRQAAATFLSPDKRSVVTLTPRADGADEVAA